MSLLNLPPFPIYSQYCHIKPMYCSSTESSLKQGHTWIMGENLDQHTICSWILQDVNRCDGLLLNLPKCVPIGTTYPQNCSQVVRYCFQIGMCIRRSFLAILDHLKIAWLPDDTACLPTTHESLASA